MSEELKIHKAPEVHMHVLYFIAKIIMHNHDQYYYSPAGKHYFNDFLPSLEKRLIHKFLSSFIENNMAHANPVLCYNSEFQDMVRITTNFVDSQLFKSKDSYGNISKISLNHT